MLQTIRGVFGAFEEGLALARIAGRHENDPVEMTGAIQDALAQRRAPKAIPVILAPAVQQPIETLEPEKAAA